MVKKYQVPRILRYRILATVPTTVLYTILLCRELLCLARVHFLLSMPITASEGSAGFAAARENLDDLIKRRFFYRQAFEIYGGVGGFYTYGPPGAAVKQNLISLWRNHFVIEENLLEVDDTCIMPHDVLFTSGHVERFNDFIVKDAKVRDD